MEFHNLTKAYTSLIIVYVHASSEAQNEERLEHSFNFIVEANDHEITLYRNSITHGEVFYLRDRPHHDVLLNCSQKYFYPPFWEITIAFIIRMNILYFTSRLRVPYMFFLVSILHPPWAAQACKCKTFRIFSESLIIWLVLFGDSYPVKSGCGPLLGSVAKAPHFLLLVS